MFDESRCNYATIVFGGRIIQGYCYEWRMVEKFNCVQLRIDGAEYVVSINNVLLEYRI